MSQIYDPALDYSAGLDFNYDRWTAGSTLLLTTVNWDSQYRDVVKFASAEALATHIAANSRAILIDRLYYIKPSAQYVTLDIPYNDALAFNYLSVKNAAQPGVGDRAAQFYYFVTHVEYQSPRSTRFYIQLDVFQSLAYTVTLRSGYLERGHYGLALTGADLKTPEPFDKGEMYVNSADVYSQNVINATTGHGAISWNVAITSVVELTSPPSKDNMPVMNSAIGTVVQGVLSPPSMYVMPLSDYFNFMTFAMQYPWIVQGIVEVSLVPASLGMGTRITRKPWPGNMNWPPGDSDDGTTDGYLRNVPSSAGVALTYPQLSDVPGKLRAAMKSVLPTEWHWAVDRFTKFSTSPFTYLEFHSNQGESTALLPEGWTGDVNITGRCSIVPGDVSLTFTSDNYAYDKGVSNLYSMNNMPKLPVLNNNAGIALANQAHSIQSARAGASWAQEKAMMGAGMSRTSAYAGNNLANDLHGISGALDAEQTGLTTAHMQAGATVRAVTGIAGGALGGAGVGGVAGAGMGALAGAGAAVVDHINTGMNVDLANNQLAARTNAANSSRKAQSDTALRMSDMNYSLATQAARGDYAQTIAAMDASVQDTMMTPPSMAGQFGGALGVIAKYGALALRARVKHMSASAIIKHAQQWARYGYYVGKFISIGRLDMMQKFTYWKLQETYLEPNGARMNEVHLLAFRGIFEKGVTVWSNPNDIGTYDFEGNTVR